MFELLTWVIMPYKNSEDARASGRRSYQKHKEKVLAGHAAWREKNPNRQKEYARRRRSRHLVAKYGITADDYDRMYSEQNGLCLICESPNHTGRFDRLHVDHCHYTGKVRGLLCNSCNMGIGQLKSARNLRRAAEYMEAHR